MTIHRDFDPRPVTPAQAWITRVVASVAGFGYFPAAPGTVGTVAPAVLLIAIRPDRTWPMLAAAVVVYLVGVVVAGWGERLWRRSDPGHVCIDEVVGYLVTVMFVPAHNDFLLYIAAFFVFRVFDILKPPPGRLAEKLPAGWGIMTDDVVAGVYANVVLRIASAFGLF